MFGSWRLFFPCKCSVNSEPTIGRTDSASLCAWFLACASASCNGQGLPGWHHWLRLWYKILFNSSRECHKLSILEKRTNPVKCIDKGRGTSCASYSANTNVDEIRLEIKLRAGALCRNASHFSTRLSNVIPTHKIWAASLQQSYPEDCQLDGKAENSNKNPTNQNPQ